MKVKRRSFGLAALGAAIAPRRATATESPELRISSLEGFGFLPLFIALDRKLIESHAAARGLENPRINHVPLHSAIISTDAWLAGQLDVIAGTVTSLLVLWDKTNGDVRAVADLGGQMLTLVTRNPSIHSIKDFGPGDRIAVPSVKQGPHSLVIGMALDKAYGPGSYGKLDSIQVQSGHADAVTMVLNPLSEENSHFSTLPYVDTELKSESPKLRAVLTREGVLYSGVPTRTMLVAAQMARTGLIRKAPADWKEFHFPFLHHRSGS